MPSTPFNDIPSILRALDNTESELEAHKLYNLLGHFYYREHDYPNSLRAHRNEKRICHQLLSTDASNATYLRDLAIAYRQCGNVMLKVPRLKRGSVVVDEREHILAEACRQHRQALRISKGVERAEVQKSLAACAQGHLALALETRAADHFERAAKYSYCACQMAKGLGESDGVSKRERTVMFFAATHNLALAMSGLGKRDVAKTLFHRIALDARKVDKGSFGRAIANLAEEAGEEEDWALCEVYVNEWVRIAREADDVLDESDALRKLAVAQREQGMYHKALETLKLAHAICPNKAGKAEAKRFISVVEQDIEEEELWQAQMNAHVGEADRFKADGNYMKEAKSRLEAGNCAFNLQRPQQVAEHLGRYFELVDEYGCNTAVTEVKESVHNSAIANMGEAMWKMKRFEEAVKWASRELSAFDGDIAGQAQAWCNLGVYLDDFGKKEKAIEALQKSMQLADQSGEIELYDRAKINLDLVKQEQVAAEDGRADAPIVLDRNDADEMVGISSPRMSEMQGETIVRVESEGLRPEMTSARATGHSRSGSRSNSETGAMPLQEKQITVMSSQASHERQERQESHERQAVSACSQDFSVRNVRQPPAVANRPCPSIAHSVQDYASMVNRSNSRSYQSLGAKTADCSSRGVRNVVDLAGEYKRICARRHPPVKVRDMVVDAFKALSSTLIARDACDEPAIGPVILNVAMLMLSSRDVSPICETLTRVGSNHELLMDLSRNPLISPSAFDCLNSKFSRTLPPLLSIRQLDLSCSGLSGNTIALLAGSLSEKGSLPCVKILHAGKNALGRDGNRTAAAVAQLITKAANLMVLDLSLNLLSNTFMEQLVSEIQKVNNEQHLDVSQSPVKSIDLHLNNRCQPSALLESHSTEYMVSHFRLLFTLLPNLESVDVRACGGNVDMRRALRALAVSFKSFSKNIVTVSEWIEDD